MRHLTPVNNTPPEQTPGKKDWSEQSQAPFTHARGPEIPVFLSALAEGLTATGAARRAGLGRRTVFRWKEQDQAFSDAWDSAHQAAVDALEDSAYRRATVGVEEPVFYQGKIVGHVRKPSDRVLELLLKAERPDKYRERVDHTVTAAPLSQEQLQAARAQGLRPEVEEAAALMASLPVIEGTATEG